MNFPANPGVVLPGRRRTRSYPEPSNSSARRRFFSRRRSCPLMVPRLATVPEETVEELEKC